MKLDEKTLQQLALAYPSDAATLERAQAAQELLVARLVVEAARALRVSQLGVDAEAERSEREHCALSSAPAVRMIRMTDGLDAALAAYDEAVR